MADNIPTTPSAPTTAEGFLADRIRFWTSATKFMTYVVVGLIGLLLFLWWWLV
jgi:fatty acid desaturase